MEIKIFFEFKAFFEVIAELLLKKITQNTEKRLLIKLESYFLLIPLRGFLRNFYKKETLLQLVSFVQSSSIMQEGPIEQADVKWEGILPTNIC